MRRNAQPALPLASGNPNVPARTALRGRLHHASMGSPKAEKFTATNWKRDNLPGESTRRNNGVYA